MKISAFHIFLLYLRRVFSYLGNLFLCKHYGNRDKTPQITRADYPRADLSYRRNSIFFKIYIYSGENCHTHAISGFVTQFRPDAMSPLGALGDRLGRRDAANRRRKLLRCIIQKRISHANLLHSHYGDGDVVRAKV